MGVVDDRQLRLKLGRASKASSAAVRKVVAYGAMKIHASAVTSIQQGPKTGIQYGRHQASAPGEPPAADTGRLASGITLEIADDEALVISNAAYSAALEFGTRFMEPRPFMMPAYVKHRDSIRKMLKGAAGGITS